MMASRGAQIQSAGTVCPFAAAVGPRWASMAVARRPSAHIGIGQRAREAEAETGRT